ncbi:MAG: FtsX-like permease family protein [Chloroflexi bacterium]|nr:FtsX-like permease family protein [Chloroflexota bacterium]MCC6895364.1 FtsX-like permease family protein [Anaerolineae bacterium]
MRRFFFYLKHAITNLRHSGHWTTFAVFCVAAGVATVVALRSLGLAIDDSLINNLRQYNHGDINASSITNFGPFAATFQRGEDERQVLRPDAIAWTRDWVAQHNATMTAYALVSNLQLTPFHTDGFTKPQFTSSFLIDPQTFDITGAITAIEPAGVRLKDLFTGGYDVVISQNLAEAQGLKPGDEVRVSGTDQPFTVRGVVSTDTEASINNILASFFGFAYFDAKNATLLNMNSNPNTVGIVMPEGSSADEIEAAANELTSLTMFREINATPWLLERNQELADLIGRFIVTMGLGAMLIGGVGIMNTMLVLVGRRTMEIAALKTFGLKGRQIGMLFMGEAFLLGILGSILGVIVGLVLSGAVNVYGEAFLQQKLPWRVYPEAILYGVVLGMVVTVVFGVLPIVMAAKVRPAIVLRPNETHVPRASVMQMLGALAVVVVVLGVIAGQIIGPVVDRAVDSIIAPPSPIIIGIALVAGTMLVLGFLTGVMWLIVWFIGKLPTLGQIDMRLALRNLSSRRLRTATTLLALTAGMFALSAITYFGLGTREIVRFQFAQTLGGNVMLVPLVPSEVAQTFIQGLLRLQGGVEYSTQLNINTARLRSVNGERVRLEGTIRTLPLSVLTRETDNPEVTSGPLLAGRDLTDDDRGKNVIVMTQQNAFGNLIQGFDSLEELGITVGSMVELSIQGRQMTFEVVGIVGTASRFTPSIANAYIPPGIDGLRSNYRINVVQVEPEQVDEFLTNINKIPFVFAVDVSFIDGLLKRVIDQLAAIPTVVGILSLLAAAVIMANTVSLTMLERRQQIGVLKVLGLSRKRVLRVVLLENIVIGLLGGVLGIGISSLGVSILTLIGTGFTIPIPTEATLITIGLVIASVVIAWVATLVSARVAIRETVAKILRYE